MGFIIHFYIIFGTNLLTEGPVQIVVFLPISVFRRKGISNRMKPLGEWFLEQTWSRGLVVDVKKQTRRPRGREARLPPWARHHPCGPLPAPPTDFFLLYIPIYPENIQEHHRSAVPPPKAFVATENQSRPVPAPCRRGESLSDGHLHHPGTLHDEEGVVLPEGNMP